MRMDNEQIFVSWSVLVADTYNILEEAFKTLEELLEPLEVEECNAIKSMLASSHQSFEVSRTYWNMTVDAGLEVA